MSFLEAAGGDGEDAGRELVAGGLLEQRGILAAVQEVLVGPAGGLLLHHLAFLPSAVDLHGEAADGRALGQGDAELAFDNPVLRVLEGELEPR
ncbi:MAG: hypothetical protein QM765_22930 [Myxococcales bacterium]